MNANKKKENRIDREREADRVRERGRHMLDCVNKNHLKLHLKCLECFAFACEDGQQLH